MTKRRHEQMLTWKEASLSDKRTFRVSETPKGKHTVANLIDVHFFFKPAITTSICCGTPLKVNNFNFNSNEKQFFEVVRKLTFTLP